MYIVIKKEDALQHLSATELHTLDTLLNTIIKGRARDNKKPINKYYVCNVDEPYAQVVHGVIIGGEAVKANHVNSNDCSDVCGTNCYKCLEEIF